MATRSAPARPCLAAVAAALLQVYAHGAAAQATAPADPPALATNTLPPVTVSGTAPAPAETPSSFPEFNGSLIGEVPASFGLLRGKDLKNEGARSLSSAIRGEPSAADAYNTVGFIETLQVRGFTLDGLLNYRRNGLPVSNYMPFALESKDRIELQKGLTGAVAGSASPGGVVNFVSKRPTAAALAEASLDLSERGSTTLHADLGGRSASGMLGYRLNLLGEERRPQARDAHGRRTLAAAAFDLRAANGLRAEIEAEVQNSRQVSVPGFGLLDTDGDGVAETLPAPIDPRINLNNQPWSQPFDSRAAVGTARIEAPLAANWRASIATLWQRVHINDRLAFPDGCSTGPQYVYPGLCGNHDVDIYDYRSDDERRTTRVLEAALDGRLATGPLQHALRLGLRRTAYKERFPAFQAYNFVGSINALAPTALPPDASATNPNAPRTLRLRELSAVDAIAWRDWSLWLGSRLVRIEGESSLSDGSEALRFETSAATPWFALARKLGTDAQVYASFSRGLELEAVPNRPAEFNNPGAVLPPHRSRQVEFGWRGAPAAGQLLSLALFRIDRPQSDDLAEPCDSDPTAACARRIAGGRQARHRGLEAQWLASLSRRWQANVALAWLDAEVARSIEPAFSGKRPTNVPRLAANAVLTWRPDAAALPGLAVTNRLSHSGRRAITRDNAVELPAWSQWDLWFTGDLLLAGYRGQWRAGVDNLTDRRYWREAPTQSWGGIYLFPAQPRSFRAGLTLAI